jgi:cell division protein FtsL
MIRVLNFFCVALMGLSILALYHVSERTRVARVELSKIDRRIAGEQAAMSVLETEWAHVAGPERIERLAQSKLGLDNTTTAQLSSLELLPRRGEEEAPLGGTRARPASAIAPAQSAPLQQVSTRSGM